MTGHRFQPERRRFLSGVAATGAASVVGLACKRGKRQSAPVLTREQVEALLPSYRKRELLRPDSPGAGPIPDGHDRYPERVVRVFDEKPGRGGPPIRTMQPWWGPSPPGLGRNSYLDAVNAELGVVVDPSIQDGLTFASRLSTALGARDVPDVLTTPNWEVGKIPRFSQAVKVLFEDLTEHLQGDAVKRYPMLASVPTSAWRHCIWAGRLAAVPLPSDSPFPLALFHRKELCEAAGVETPKTIDEFHEFGRTMTDPKRGVWAFGPVFDMLQMFFGVPGVRGGWRLEPSGKVVFKYELPEYREALEYAARLFKDGLIHPDVVENNGADAKQLFASGKIIAYQDGLAIWRGARRDKITRGIDVQPIPLFSATGGRPVAWTRDEPTFYTFVKKGLGIERLEEILRVIDWCASPLGSVEHQIVQYGVEGKHFERLPDGSPTVTELGQLEVAGQYRWLGGRVPTLVGGADAPDYVQQYLHYARATYAHREPDPFSGMKIEWPPHYSRVIVPTDDKIKDIVRGRRAIGDLAQIVAEWRNAGGDEGRAYLEKLLDEKA